MSTGNPLLDRFKELQPDVDVVVLPPEPLLADVPVASPDDAERAARATRAGALGLVAEVGTTDEPVVLERWDRLAPGIYRHRTRVRATLSSSTAALAAILDVLDALGSTGWTSRPVDAPTPWLVATSPPQAPVVLTADVAVQGETLVVTIESAPLRLDEAPA